MAIIFRFKSDEEKSRKISEDSSKDESIGHGALYWYALMAKKGIEIKLPKNHQMFLSSVRREQSSAVRNFEKYFYNEVKYPCDVLIEFSDLSACFWDRTDAEKRYVIISYDELKRKGFAIISFPSFRKDFKRQQVMYELWKRGTSLPRNAQVCNSKPPDVEIMLDQTYRRVRLSGSNCIFGNCGRWFRFKREW